MDTTIYSIIMSFVWCSIFIFVSIVLRNKKGFILKYGVNLVLIIMIIAILRLLLPFEPSFAIVVNSNKIMPTIQLFLKSQCLYIFGISISWFSVFITAWALVSIVLTLRILVEIHVLNSLVRKLHSVDNSQVESIMNKIIQPSKPKQKYRIIISDDIPTPMLVGFFKPTILLPPLSLSDEDMEYVLLHEWYHFIHKDLWKKLFINVFCALLWWNPLVYYLKKDVDYILEVNCDRHVVNNSDSTERIKYVESIVKVMKQIVSPTPKVLVSSIGFVSTTNENKIVQRSELVLYPPKKANKCLSCILGIALFFLICTSYIFIVQPITKKPPQQNITSFVEITPENSYISVNKSGSYKLFINGQFIDFVNSVEIDLIPYSNLPIIHEEE